VMSFGCGTGLATLKMLKKLKNETSEAPTVILLDQDPLSLAAAQSLAKKWDLEETIS
jgi:predicted O-methyltransferase YrrM